MASKLRGLALLVCVAGIVTLTGAAGSPAGTTFTTTRYCSQPDPQGRLVCIDVEDTDGVSPSGVAGSGARSVGVVAYQYYKLSVFNNGGSTLTNGSLDVVLKDTVPDTSTSPAGTKLVDSKAVFVSASPAGMCTLTTSSPPTLNCALPNLPAGAPAPTITLVFKTSTNAGVTATTAQMATSFKESAKKGANPSLFPFSETTSLEPLPEQSVSWSPEGQTVAMGTSPTFDTQFSRLDYKVPVDKAAFGAKVTESNGFVCKPGIACFGELITTDLGDAAAGTFSGANPFHLTTTLSLDVVPGGNTSNIVMSHRLDSGAFETVDRECTSKPPSATEQLPCLRVTKDNRAKLLIVDVWGVENGGWMTGG